MTQTHGAPLAVTRVTLTDFRCYAHLRLETDARSVVLTGPNGSGKTNLLEALSFLIPGRGLRRATLAEVARRDGSGQWAVAAQVSGADGLPVSLGTGRLPPQAETPDRRTVHLDGETVKSQAVLANHISAVWLTPRLDGLFLEGASARRRFLDRMIFGLDPAHAGRINAWDHAARARSKLLREGRGDATWLSALEQTLAEKGIAIAAARLDMAARLNAACAKGVGPFPAASVALEGAVEQWLSEGPALAAEDRLRAALADARGRDAETGGAGAGPHRSDLLVRHLGKDQPAEHCSTGEQKAVLIALILADARMQAADRGSPPLLLLDEVAAHLDAERRAALFDEIEALGAQAWMTGTDRSLFAPLAGRAKFVGLRDGAIDPAASDD